ncbi:cholinesterase 2-like [Achroia grisella]|uniref:cholinesterase 2-like n=1 Tax=Achroia grisella TaxID=688607 RepID=UPI0027D303DD|nr:cholinesterase 2-like [Achroia grisella]
MYICHALVPKNSVCALSSWTVETTQALFKGSIAPDGDYYTFLGLKYGKSITNENRFMAPQPADEYYGLYLADYTKHCLQPPSQGPNAGIEDCLELNIYAKNYIASQPVIVWLEGEEYLSTKIKTTFRRLVQKNTIVVSLNYRVSIFGFLCLGVPEAPGNAGLKDVILGLRWIKENIIQFGGDPNNVMLLGHGSGAAMVDLITMSPLSKDLVHKAFVISGSALAPWAISYDPIGYANIVGEKLAYSGKTPRKLAEELKSIDIDVLLYALNIEFTNNTVLFAPCVENDKLQDPFLYDTPINILKNGSFNHIPYVAAFADREGTLRANKYSDWLTKMESNFISFIPRDLEFGSEMEKTFMGNSIREFYFNNSANISIKDYLDYHGDTSIIVPLIRGVKVRAKMSRANVYLLEFAYRGSTIDDWPHPNIPLNGVKHGEILEYLFDKDMTKHGENAKTSLINYISSFARTGIPSSNAVSEQKWLPVQSKSFNYLYFGGVHGNPHTEVLQRDPHAETVTFWNDLYDNFHKIPNEYSNSTEYLISRQLSYCHNEIEESMFNINNEPIEFPHSHNEIEESMFDINNEECPHSHNEIEEKAAIVSGIEDEKNEV